MSIVAVAKLAGVSHATVSRVINQRKGVSLETVRSVEEVMKRIGYVPSPTRRGPKPRSAKGLKKYRVAMIVNGARMDGRAPAGFVSLLRGTEAALAEQNCQLNLVFNTELDQLPAALKEEPIDGVLLTGDLPLPTAEAMYRRWPAVWLMANPVRPTWGDHILPDNEAVGRIGARYLLDRGYSHLAYFDVSASPWYLKVRRSAFANVAAEAGATVEMFVSDPPNAMALYAKDSREGMRFDALFERYISLPRRATGLFLSNESRLAQCYAQLAKHGLEPGKDVAVISCNNEHAFLDGLFPPPATIDIRFAAIGQFGVERLMWRIAHPQEQGRVTTLVEPLLVAPDVGAME